MKYESDIKRTCNIIKEVFSKSRSPFPNKTIVDIEIKDNSLIAGKFNNFFADIIPKLASKINQSIFKSYYKYVASSLLKNPTINEAEFKTTLFALKRNKTCYYDEISANIVRGFMKKCTSLSFIVPANT